MTPTCMSLTIDSDGCSYSSKATVTTAILPLFTSLGTSDKPTHIVSTNTLHGYCTHASWSSIHCLNVH